MRILQFGKIIIFFTQSLILGIVFGLPLSFAWFLQTNNVFELSKLVLFKILVLLLVFFTLIKIIINKNYNYKKIINNRIAFFLLVFVLFLAFPTLFSINSGLSWHGSYDSLQGLETFLYLIVFFFLLLINIKTKKQTKSIIWAMVLSSVGVCAYALLQAAGHDIFVWSESTQARVTSTLGQPNHLAAYLLLVMPLSAYLFLAGKKIITRIALSLLLIAQILTLIFTYSLSAWIGMMSAVILISILIISVKIRKKELNSFKKELSSFFVLIVLIIIIFLFYSNFSSIGLNKIKYLFNFESGSTAARIQFWKAAAAAIKERPLFGYGPDTQGEVLAKYYRTDWAVPNNVNVRPTRAHNFFLDILLTEGIIGLLAWCALLYLFYYYLIINIKKNKEKTLNYAIFTALTAYLIFLQFQYHNITTLVYFFTLFALVLVINKKDKDKNLEVFESNSSSFVIPAKAGIQVLKIIIVLLAAGFICISINNNFKAIAADHYFFELRKARLYNEYMYAFDLYGFIKEISPGYDYYDKQFAAIMYDWGNSFNNRLFYQFINRRFKNILPEINSDNYSDELAKARIYTSLSQEDDKYYKSAIDSYKALIALSPEIPRNYYELGRLYVKQGNYDLAISNYKLALTKLPSLDNPYFNAKHLGLVKNETIMNLAAIGDTYLKQGDTESAASNYTKALEINPENMVIYNKLEELNK